MKKIINALSGTKWKFLIVLAVNTGARLSELLALTYDDMCDNTLTISKQVCEVSFGDNKGIHLTKTKSVNSNRQIPLSKKVLKELEKHKAIHMIEMEKNNYNTNVVFSSSVGKYLYRHTVISTLKKYYKNNDIPNHTFHSFRHTFATNLCRAGVPLEQTCKLMGHSSINVTQQYYISISNDEKLSAVEQISKYSFG